jgi:hypothetical protein
MAQRIGTYTSRSTTRASGIRTVPLRPSLMNGRRRKVPSCLLRRGRSAVRRTPPPERKPKRPHRTLAGCQILNATSLGRFWQTGRWPRADLAGQNDCFRFPSSASPGFRAPRPVILVGGGVLLLEAPFECVHICEELASSVRLRRKVKDQPAKEVGVHPHNGIAASRHVLGAVLRSALYQWKPISKRAYLHPAVRHVGEMFLPPAICVFEGRLECLQ